MSADQTEVDLKAFCTLAVDFPEVRESFGGRRIEVNVLRLDPGDLAVSHAGVHAAKRKSAK